MVRIGQLSDQWAQSYYVFENGDGTRYTIHICKCENGGLYVICNDDSLWLYFGNVDLKFLCGNNNEYTEKAILQCLILKGWGDEK